MLVSALLTSVVLNSILCVLLFVSYSSLRKKPNNYDVYIPRFLGDATSKGKNRFNLVRWSSSSSWIAKAWDVSEAELLESSGLDAVVFMRMITLSLEIFVLAGIIGIFILLPINCSGDQLQVMDFTDLASNSLDLFTISNIKSGSPRLWVHFAAVYIMTAFTCCLLYREFKHISSKRVEYFSSSKPQSHQFTILVRGIPCDHDSTGGSVSDTVGRFFKEYHSSQYLSHLVIRRTSKISYLVNHAKKIYKKLQQMKSDPAEDKKGLARFFRSKTTDQCQRQLEDLEQHLRLGQTEVSLPGKEVRAAFVSFKSRYGAVIALHIPQSVDPTLWITEPAPEPHDVYWPFFSTSFMKKWISKTMIVVMFIVLTVLFLIPVVLVQGLTNLSTLEYWFPFLTGILSIKFVRQIVTGYLPSLILGGSLMTVPPIMKFLSSIQGYICHSDIEKSACSKVIWFTIWNVFFATVFSGSALYQVSLFLEPKDIPAKLAVAVPAQASFFIAYVVTSGWTSTLIRLIRFFPLVVNFIQKLFSSTDDDIEVPSIPYHRDIPKVLFFGLLGFTYLILAPLILPFLVIYLCLAYIIYKNEFINVYAPKYETAGRFWPIVHNTMIFSLLLMHAIAIGIFTIKNMTLATFLLFPLPILTLLFNQYCRKSFLTTFQAYPAELLINKDKDDQKDDNMQEFYDRLATAYLDPALLPFQFSASKDSPTSPLLSSQA